MNGNHGGLPVQEVQATLPINVYVGGLLLPRAAVSLEGSALQPTVCDITIVGNHPLLPKSLREAFSEIQPSTDQKAPALLRDLRVQACIVQNNGMPALIELQPRSIRVVRQPEQPSAPSGA